MSFAPLYGFAAIPNFATRSAKAITETFPEIPQSIASALSVAAQRLNQEGYDLKPIGDSNRFAIANSKGFPATDIDPSRLNNLVANLGGGLGGSISRNGPTLTIDPIPQAAPISLSHSAPGFASNNSTSTTNRPSSQNEWGAGGASFT